MADSKEFRGASQNKRRLAGRKSSGIRGGSTLLVGALAILACAEAIHWIVKRRRAAKQITRNSDQVEYKSTVDDSPSSDVVSSSTNTSPDLGLEEECHKDQSSNAGICSGNGALEDTSDAGKLVVSKDLGTPDVAKLGCKENSKDHTFSDGTNVDNGVLEICGHEQENNLTASQDDHAPALEEKLDDNLLHRKELTSSILTEGKELTPLLEMSQIDGSDASSIEGLNADFIPEHEVAKGLKESTAVYVDEDLVQEVSIKQVIFCNLEHGPCDSVLNDEVNEVREQKSCEEPAEELDVEVLADNLVDDNELKKLEDLDPAAAVINKVKAADGLQVLIQLSTDHKFTSKTVSTDESKHAVSVEQKQQAEVDIPAEDMKKHAQPVAEITLVANDLSVDKVKPAEVFKLKLESLTNSAHFAATPAQDLKKVIKPLEILKKTEGQQKAGRHRPWIEDLWQMIPVAMEVAFMFIFIGFIVMLLKHLPGLSPSVYPSD